MNALHKIWNEAKIGLKIWLGPITLHLKMTRTVNVSTNHPRSPLVHTHAPMMAPQTIPSGGYNVTSAPEPAVPATPLPAQVALIVGAGLGLGSSLARRFAQSGMQVAMAARNSEKLGSVLQTISSMGGTARAYGCDATEERSVKQLIELVTREMGVPDLVVYNVEHFCPGTIVDIETAAFEECWRAMALGGFLVGRESARQMVPRGSGTIIYTGATGALRGRAEYINMAIGKFGVRALAQSMARDLGPKGIHVAHVVLDGGILSERSPAGARERMSSMDPDQIAEVYYQLHKQHRSTWTQEMDLRPWVEKF